MLVITLYLIGINIYKYFQVSRELASPLLPRSVTEEILKAHLYISIFLLSCFIVAFVFHRYHKYFISVGFCILAVLLVNYYPELFVNLAH